MYGCVYLLGSARRLCEREMPAPFSASQPIHAPGAEAPLAAGAAGPGIWGVGESMHQCVLGWRGGRFV